MIRQTEFSMIPTQEELDRVPRTLRFFPTSNHDPRVLDREQIERFNRDGYLAGIAIFAGEEVAGNRAYFDALLAAVTAAGGDSYSISSAHLKYGPVYDLLTHPRIVGCCQDLLGENVIGWGAHFFCKLPRDGKTVAWHQDASYWPLTPSKAVTVWLAIDDVDRENACMQVIPGSHLHGHLAYRSSGEGEANVLDQTIDHVEQYGQPVDVELRAGEISIHADLLLHGSVANVSDRRRCGLTLRYCPADVLAYLGWNQKGVVVAGQADPDRWPGVPRPERSL